MANTFRKFDTKDQQLIVEISKVLFPRNSEHGDPVFSDGCVQNIIDKNPTKQTGLHLANGNFFPASDMLLEWWFMRLIHFTEKDFNGAVRPEPKLPDAERHWILESERFNIWRADKLRSRGAVRNLMDYMATRVIELFKGEVDVSAIESLM